MKRIAIVIGIMIICLIQIKAQERTPSFIPIIPPSPNAASLGLLSTVPVGLYNGTANINIPIYNIELDGEVFPISLSYNTSGIKVDQESGYVGLGWSLSGIGCIVKQINGLDDFKPFMGYFANHNPLTPEEVKLYRSGKGSNPNDDAKTKGERLLLLKKIKEYGEGRLDSQPDIFHYNFGQYSGTMFFEPKEQSDIGNNRARPIVQKRKDNLRVEYNYYYDIWKITDGKGYVYYFGSQEITENWSKNTTSNLHPSKVKRNGSEFGSQGEAITAWYLDSIVSPNKNKIEFQYREEYVYTLMRKNEEIYQLLEVNAVNSSPFQIFNNSFSYSKIKQLVIDKIKIPLGEIKFATEDRFDLEPANTIRPKRVSGVSVKNNSSHMIKNIMLSYNNQGIIGEYDSYRFFLKEVKDITDIENPLSHKFEYFDPLLPSKFSNEKDFWGYYNGLKASGKIWDTSENQKLAFSDDITYIPESQFKLTRGESIPKIKTFLGRRIEVSLKNSKAGLLKSIEYPTGLKNKFYYTPHEVVNNGIPPTYATDRVYGGHVQYKNYIDDDTDEEEQYKETLEATLYIPIDALSVQMYYSVYIKDQNREEGYYDTGMDMFYNRIQVRDQNNQIIKRFPVASHDTGKPCWEELGQLPPGRYTIKIFLNKHDSDEIATKFRYRISASLNYEIQKEIGGSKYGGGLRVDSIVSMNSDGNVLRRKKYTYQDGKLMNNTMYNYIFTSEEKIQEGGTIFHVSNTYAVGLSSPYYAFSTSALGAHVGYSRVTESDISDPSSDERKVFYFWNSSDKKPSGEGASIPDFPWKRSPRNGMLELSEVMNDQNEIVEEIEYDYRPYISKKLEAVKTYLIPYIHSDLTTKVALDTYELNNYTDRLTEKSTYRATEASVYEYYSYTDKNDLPITQSLLLNNGIRQHTVHKYPTDFNDEISILMRDKNMISNELETIGMKENSIISGQKTSYTVHNKMILPKSYYQLNTSQQLSEINYSDKFTKEYTVELYSDKGKPLMISDKSGVNTTFIWSYWGQYLIAEIKNTSYSDIEKILGKEWLLKLTNREPTSVDLKTIRELESKLNDILMTTYTYKPLVGITSVTNHMGITTLYEYDKLGRLVEIYFHENNDISKKRLIKTYDYHYQNK